MNRQEHWAFYTLVSGNAFISMRLHKFIKDPDYEYWYGDVLWAALRKVMSVKGIGQRYNLLTQN